jgi:hypothetical protein
MLKHLINKWVQFKTAEGRSVDAKLLDVDAMYATVCESNGKRAAHPLTGIVGSIVEVPPPDKRSEC